MNGSEVTVSRANDTRPKSCAIYARTALASTAAIDRQVEACALRATELGAEVQYLYIDDGVSGMELGEGLRHLLDASRLGGIDYVIVEDQARFSRSMALSLFVLAELSTAGVEVEMTSEPDWPRDPALSNRGLR